MNLRVTCWWEAEGPYGQVEGVIIKKMFYPYKRETPSYQFNLVL